MKRETKQSGNRTKKSEFQVLGSKVDTNSKEIQGLSQKVNTNTQKIEELSQKVDANTKKIEENGRKIDKLETRMEKGFANCFDIFLTKVDFYEYMDHFQRQINDRFTRIEDTLVSILDRHTTEMTILQSRYHELDDKVANHENRIIKLEKAVTI